MRWRSDADNMLEELYTLGKKGNLAVLKKSLLATEMFYIGAADECPLFDKNAWYIGKKKWDWGKFIYIEQKQ